MAKARPNKAGVIGVELPECPVCLDTMSAPIFQCQSGHSLCHSCTQNLRPSICPICRQLMTEMRNWQLEDLISKAAIPCPNKKLGCIFTIMSSEVEDHIKECIFREMTCPLGLVFGKCSWSGKLKEIMDHVVESHPDNFKLNLDAETDLNNFSISKDDRFIYLTSFGKFLFILTIKIDTCKKIVYWVVQHIGSKKSAQNFSYELLITSKQDARRQVKFSDHCYNDTYNINEIFQQSKCGLMPINMLNNFIKDKQITIRLSILKSQPMTKNNSNESGNVGSKSQSDTNNKKNQFRGRSPGPNNRPNRQNQFTGKSPGPNFKPRNPGSTQRHGHRMSNKTNL